MACCLSHAQEPLWFLEHFGVGSAYNVPGTWRLEGALDVVALEHSFGDVVEVFKTNPDIVLSLDEIVSHRIGWGTKPAAIAELAGELKSELVVIDQSQLCWWVLLFALSCGFWGGRLSTASSSA